MAADFWAMKYTLHTIRRIHVEIINESGETAGRALLYMGRGWEIFNAEWRHVGLTRWKAGIIKTFIELKDRIEPLPPKRPLCDECPLKDK